MNLFFQKNNGRGKRLAFVGVALALVVFADFVFWNKMPGLNVLAFTFLYIAGFVIVAFATKHARQQLALLLLIPIFLLALAPVLYANTLVQSLLFFVLGFLIFIFSLLFTLRNPHKHKFHFKHIPAVTDMFLPFLKLGNLYRDIFVWKGEEDSKRIFKRITIGLAIAIPIVFIFMLLFAQADEVFFQYTRDFFDYSFDVSVTARIFRIFIGTTVLAAFWYVFISKDHVLGSKDTKVKRFDAIIVGVILGLINALFLIFVFIQIKYLFGGAPVDFELTFAEYARRGFFELAWVVFLTACIQLIVYRSYAHHKSPIVITLLQLLLVGQVGVIAFSALTRMNLYQDAFGFTVKRLYVEWFIYFVLALLLFLAISLVTRLTFRKFFFASLAFGLTAFVVVSLVNVDYIIAKENVRRFVEDDKELDLRYFEELSSDAAPALTPLVSSAEFVQYLSDNPKKVLSTKVHVFSKLLVSYQSSIEKRDSIFEWYAGMKGTQELLDATRDNTELMDSFQKLDIERYPKPPIFK